MDNQFALMIRLGDIAITRSGDKGNHVNLAVIARDEATFRWLADVLTAELVAKYFGWMGVERVERFVLPNVWAFNFVLYNALAGGASRSLRWDSQGKLVGTLAQELLLPDNGAAERARSSAHGPGDS